MPENLASAMTDSVSKGAVKFALESVVPSDVVGRVFAGFRTLTESPTVADSVARVFSGAMGISEDLASLISDTANRGTFSFLSEAVAPSDLATRVFDGFRTLSETPSVSDAADRVFTGFRTTSEDLASMIADVINRGVARSLSEVVSVAVSLNKGAGKFPFLSVVPSDVVGRVFTGARAISENSVSAISDGVTRAFTGFRSTSENLASAIAASVRKDVGKFPLETVVPSDVVSRVFTRSGALWEGQALSDAGSRDFTWLRITSESRASA